MVASFIESWQNMFLQISFFSVQSIVLDRAEIGRIGRISRSVIFRRCRKMTENRKCRKIFATLLVLIFAQHGNGGFLILFHLKKRAEVSLHFFSYNIFLSTAISQRPRNYLSCSCSCSSSPFGSFPH